MIGRKKKVRFLYIVDNKDTRTHFWYDSGFFIANFKNRIITRLQGLHGCFEQLFTCLDELCMDQMFIFLKETGHGGEGRKNVTLVMLQFKNDIFLPKNGFVAGQTMIKWVISAIKIFSVESLALERCTRYKISCF